MSKHRPMAYRPTHCPHCGKEVEKVRTYLSRTPPDERDNHPPTVEPSDSLPSSPPPTFDEVECQALYPCGHLYRERDIKAFLTGDVPAVALGDRVLNPNSPVEADDE